MNSSKGRKLQVGVVKFLPQWSLLFASGFAVIGISHFIIPKAPPWVSEIGYLMILVGLLICLVGTVTDRREWEAQLKLRCGDKDNTTKPSDPQ